MNARNFSLSFYVKSELIARFYSKEEIKTESSFTLMGFFGLFICFLKWVLSICTRWTEGLMTSFSMTLIINYIRKGF